MEVQEDVRDVNQDTSSVEETKESSDAKDTVSYETHKKLLAQRKADQERLRELEAKFQSIEESKLEAEGRKDELVESLRKRLEEKDNALNDIQKQYATKTLTEQIKAKAVELGCKPNYADKLIRLMDDSDLKSIQVDENYMANHDDLRMVLEKTKKDVPDFFSKTVTIGDSTPSNNPYMKPSDRSKLSTKELIEDYINNVKP